MFDVWVNAFSIALMPHNLLYIVLGALYGLFVGALPGLGPLFGVALMLPVTFYMDPATAIIFLSAIHAATAYGDSWASVLINTPGGVGSVATAWDGYQLAQQGKSGYAMGAVTAASLIGGVLGWVALVTLSPQVTKIALAMGPAEYATLGLLALSMLSVASAGNTMKGLILGGLGLMVSFIGRDAITATARFTFGSLFLEDGLPLVAIVLGLFAFSEAIIMAEKGGQISKFRELSGGVLEGMYEVVKRPITIVRSAVIGSILGAMPALGLSTANIISYFVEKRSSKDPDSYGKGNIGGVIAPEVANNACVVAELIPTLTLGIPGAATVAIFLAALMIHGVQVGPSMFANGGIGYTIFAGILLAQFAFFIFGGIAVRWAAKIVLIPSNVLVPAIVIFSFIGAFANRYRLSDILVTITFGILGYIMKKYNWPAACMVLGLVLGTIIESNFARAMLISGGDYMTFFTRPISATLLVAMVLFLASPYLGVLYRKITGKGFLQLEDDTNQSA